MAEAVFTASKFFKTNFMNEKQYLEITQWQDFTFKKATPLSCAKHLREEVKELIEKFEEGIIDENEIADCFMLLFGICNKSGFWYDKVVDIIYDKFFENQKRQWGEPNEQGYVKHI